MGIDKIASDTRTLPESSRRVHDTTNRRMKDVVTQHSLAQKNAPQGEEEADPFRPRKDKSGRTGGRMLIRLRAITLADDTITVPLLK
jgi:hypothetical protein